MGLVAAELEGRGIVTAGISLMPDITRAVGQPRTLIVPFGLGRPFGAPGDREGQRSVLRALLALCTRTDVPVSVSLGV